MELKEILSSKWLKGINPNRFQSWLHVLGPGVQEAFKKRKNPERDAARLAREIVEIYIEEIWHDMVYENEEIEFRGPNGKRYMSWSIRNAPGKAAKIPFNWKTRGHWYRVFCLLNPWYYHQIGKSLVLVKPKGKFFKEMLAEIERGHDYDDEPPFEHIRATEKQLKHLRKINDEEHQRKFFDGARNFQQAHPPVKRTKQDDSTK